MSIMYGRRVARFVILSITTESRCEPCKNDFMPAVPTGGGREGREGGAVLGGAGADSAPSN